MGVLDQVLQMKNQGIPDEQIISDLQRMGISPKEINNALGQAQIKSAVSNEVEQAPSAVEEEYYPQEAPSPNQFPPAQQYQEYYPQENPNQVYQDGGAEYSNYSASDTMIEISEQVFNEKSKKMQKQLDEISQFKALAQVKIENIDERLKRIEKSLDQLQIAILQKVGAYTSGIDSIKKELSMMEDSFSKMVGHVADKAEKRHHKKKDN